MRLNELKDLLITRSYPENLVNTALDKARLISRSTALRRVIRKKQRAKQRPVFAIKYDPRLPSITNIQAKHWRSMTKQNQYLAQVFPEPPLTAFKKQKNIRDMIIRAKVPETRRYEQRIKRGTNKCGRQCTACPFVKGGNKVKVNSNTDWNINKNVITAERGTLVKLGNSSDLD